MDLDAAKEALVALGYERCAEVLLPGQFTVRGDILDIWDLTNDHPVRIELFGDEIESMRLFDAETQRSVSEIDKIRIYPANDRTGEAASFLSWFEGREDRHFLDEPTRIHEAAKATEDEFRESIKPHRTGNYEKRR